MGRIQLITKHLKGQIVRFCIVILATVLFSLLSLFSSLVFSYVIDSVISNNPVSNPILQFITGLLGGLDYIRNNLWVVALLLIAVYLCNGLLMYYRYSHQAIVAEKLTQNIREDLYNHLQLMPYSYQAKTKTGDLVQRCTSDVDQIRRFFSGQIEEVFAILSLVIVALITLININAPLALFAGLSFPVIFFYSFLFFKKMCKMFVISDEKEGEMTSFIQEALSGVRVIKAFNRERYELDAFLKHSREYSDYTFHMLKGFGAYWGLSYLICMTGILSVVVRGIFAVRSGELSTGNFFVFISYQTIVLYQIRQLGRILSDMGKLSVSIDRIQEILSEEPEDLNAGATPDLKGDICFENVSFHYDDDKEHNILKDIHFTVTRGQTVAILGPTGSGKSSLVHLLARLYEPSEGRITINGYDIHDVAKGYLRKNIGIVLQEPFLFSKSIYDNLSISSPNIEKMLVFRASQIASVHDVINSFENGYNTLVGEKGVTLSGGQKQRIAIARTILNESPILVFDDSLSAVDTQTDASIRKGLQSIGNDVTTIIITQRVLSAMDADQIIVLENGRITQQGTHQSLLAEEGLYKRVYNIQSSMKGVSDEQ